MTKKAFGDSQQYLWFCEIGFEKREAKLGDWELWNGEGSQEVFGKKRRRESIHHW